MEHSEPTLQSLIETIRTRSYYDYPRDYQNHLAVCRYPNLAAEIEATWYSLSTVASWLKCSVPALVSVLEDGMDLLFPNALSLRNLFEGDAEYLFSSTLDLCHVDQGDGTERVVTTAQYRQEIYQAQLQLEED